MKLFLFKGIEGAWMQGGTLIVLAENEGAAINTAFSNDDFRDMLTRGRPAFSWYDVFKLVAEMELDEAKPVFFQMVRS